MIDKILDTVKDEELYVAAIGTSAGGIEVLNTFLTTLNSKCENVCFVILQHLSPLYNTELSSILARNCKWPVITATHGMKLQKKHVYVTPQNKQIIYKEGTLLLKALTAKQIFSPSIDQFLLSLAPAKKEYALGIIFSGTAQDGAKGIREIKKYGGMTIAQEPESAEFPGMPVASINTGSIDLISQPHKIFEELCYYVSNQQVIKNTVLQHSGIDVILELLSKRSGVDFTQYKQNTIRRRIQKRIESLSLSSLEDYLEVIKAKPLELETLFDTVLIGVTNFFRDKDAFDGLEKQVKEMLDLKKFNDTIRVWCVGCATGEEAYSIAILFHEILGKQIHNYQLQIFASDIDERALNFGRKGLYRSDSLGDLPNDIINKYFDRKDHGYEVKKFLKQHILFSKHNIINDPPFVKLDILVCRNLLIYFNNFLQKEVLRIFNYALRNDGLLFLGKSESKTVADDLFEKVDGLKLYRKIQSSLPLSMRFSKFKNKLDMITERASPNKNMTLEDIAKETLYFEKGNPFVIINENGDIKESQGSLRLYMELSQGAVNANLYKMLNKEFVVEVRSMVGTVKKTSVSTKSQIIRFNIFDEEYFVFLKLIPLLYSYLGTQHYMLIFENVKPDDNFLKLRGDISQKEFEDYKITELEQEVVSLREHLQNFTEELETSNEEMQAMNEELQSINEELKSSNEELETSNEELQSTNEELHAANSELRRVNQQILDKEEELLASNAVAIQNEQLYKSIAENIPNGTVGILDKEFNIEYVAGKDLDRLKVHTNNIIGRNFPDLNPSQIQRDRLKTLFEKTLRGEATNSEFSFEEVEYSIHTLPLKFSGSDESKIMYLTQDITEKTTQQNNLRESEERFRVLADNIPILCWTAKPDGWIYWYNTRWYEFTGKDKSDIEGWGWKDVHDPEMLPAVLEKWVAAIAKGLEFEMIFPLKRHDGVYRDFLTRIIPLKNEKGNVIQWFGTNTDITEQIALQKSFRESELQFRSLAESLPQIIWMTDKDGKIIYTSERWTMLTGAKEDQEYDFKNIIYEDDFKDFRQLWNTCLDEKRSLHTEIRLKTLQGDYLWHVAEALHMENEAGETIKWVGSFTDINEQKLKEQQKDEFISIASHEMKTPLTTAKGYIDLLLMSLPENEKSIFAYAEKSQSALQRLNKLISELLDSSKIQSGVITYNNSKFDFCELLRNTVADLQSFSPKHTISFDALDSCSIVGDKDRIQQVLINLINNAVKYSPDSNKIEIAAHESGNYLKVSVTDHGVGIPAAHQTRIFDRYYRITENVSFAQGLGIGLYLSANIIERHKGKIWVESILGENTTFFFTLPLSESKISDKEDNRIL